MYIAWVLSLALVGALGYFSREIIERIKKLEQDVHKWMNRKELAKEEEQQKSIFIDLDDPFLQAKIEQEEIMRKLNDE